MRLKRQLSKYFTLLSTGNINYTILKMLILRLFHYFNNITQLMQVQNLACPSYKYDTDITKQCMVHFFFLTILAHFGIFYVKIKKGAFNEKIF